MKTNKLCLVFTDPIFNDGFDKRLKIHTTPVEYDLIKDQLQEIDEKLNNAEHLLNWNSDGK